MQTHGCCEKDLNLVKCCIKKQVVSQMWDFRASLNAPTGRRFSTVLFETVCKCDNKHQIERIILYYRFFRDININNSLPGRKSV